MCRQRSQFRSVAFLTSMLRTKPQPQEPHERQPVAELIHHLIVRQVADLRDPIKSRVANDKCSLYVLSLLNSLFRTSSS
jgi:hypothetical protein